MQLKRLVVSAFCVVGLAGSLCRGADPKPIGDDVIKKIEAALPEAAPAKPQQPRKVLVFTLATGFVHGSIPIGAKAFELMGKKTGAYETVTSNDIEMFEPEKLSAFDAVIMESTTGELFGLKRGEFEKLADADKKKQQGLRDSFLSFVKNGKGLVGVHAATDCSYTWPEYGEMIGGYFNGHPWGKVTYKIDDAASPLTAMFPKDKPFELSDETYTFKMEPYSRAKLHILTSIDIDKMSDGDKKKENRPDHDYALSWIHEFGKGRVFYAAHGHGDGIYFNPVMMQHYLAGIQYALGDLKADATPSGPVKAAFELKEIKIGN